MSAAHKGFWAHAFQVEPSEPIKEEDKTWLAKIAKAIKKRNLELPAMLALESTKPLHFVAGQAMRFVDPILGLVVPQNKLGKLAGIFERRDGAEHLIRCLGKNERS